MSLRLLCLGDIVGRPGRQILCQKLPQLVRERQIDLVVANDVTQPGAGFEHDTNAVTIITRDRDVAVPLQAKAAVADRILDHVVPLFGGRA